MHGTPENVLPKELINVHNLLAVPIPYNRLDSTISLNTTYVIIDMSRYLCDAINDKMICMSHLVHFATT